MPLIENTAMGDWLRSGPKGVIELMISHKVRSVCKLAKIMKETGQDGAPIYKEVLKMCQEKRRARRRN